MTKSFDEWDKLKFDEFIPFELYDLVASKYDLFNDWSEEHIAMLKEKAEMLNIIQNSYQDIKKINIILKSANFHPFELMENELKEFLEKQSKKD
jgi:hypothetical protein